MQNIIQLSKRYGTTEEINRIQDILEQIEYVGYKFNLYDQEKNEYAITVSYIEPDIYSGVEEKQEGRKWTFTAGQTTGQIVQTCFKAILTSLEHRAREHFKYRDKSVLMPHLDIDEIWEMLP